MSTGLGKSNLFAAYKPDEEKSVSGIWYKLRELQDVEFRIRPANKFNKGFIEAMTEVQGRIDRDPDSDATRRSIAEVVSKYLISDWKGVKDAKGNAVPYTPEIGCSALYDCEDLSVEVIAVSRNKRLFKGVYETEEEGVEVGKKSQTA